MLIGKALFSLLSADANVSPLVGSPPRISGVMEPEVGRVGGYPAIVYSGGKGQCDKANDGSTGMVRQTIKVVSQAMDYPSANGLVQAVMTCLLGTPKGTYAGILVHGFFFEDDAEGADTMEGVGQDFLVYWKSIDLTVWFNLPSL